MRNPGYLANDRIARVPLGAGGDPSAPLRAGADKLGLAFARMGEAVQAFEERGRQAESSRRLIDAQLAAANRLAQLEDEVFTDPDIASAPRRFLDGAQKIRDEAEAALAEAEPEYQDRLRANLGRLALTHQLAVQRETRTRQRDEFVAGLEGDLQATIDRAARRSDEENRSAGDISAQAIRRGVEAGWITAREGVRYGLRLREGMSEAVAQDLVERDPLSAVRRLDNPDDLAGLSPARRRELRNAAQAGVAETMRLDLTRDPAGVAARLRNNEVPELGDRQRAILIEHGEALVRARAADAERTALKAEREADRAIAAAREEAYADATVKLARGQLTAEAVMELEARGIFRASDRAHFVVGIEEQERKAAKDQALMARVAFAASTGAAVLDHRSADDRRAVDLHYDAVSAGWAGSDPAELPAKIADYVGRVRIVPKQVQAAVRAGLRSAAPADQAQAAELMDRVLTVLPQAVGDFAHEDVALGLHIAELRRAGVADDQAVRLAVDAQAQPEAVRKLRQGEIRDQRLAETAQARLKSELASRDGRWTLRSPDLPAELRAEFDTLFETRYRLSGNAEAATKAAAADLQRVWGWTEADGAGGRWMRYAPEALYGNGRDPKWMREQLMAFVQAGNALDPAKPLEGRIMLAPDALTGREERPRWQVLLKDDFGAWNPLTDAGGMPLRWRPDWSASPEGRREAAKQAEETEAMRAERERRGRQETRKRQLLDAIRSGEPLEGANAVR